MNKTGISQKCVMYIFIVLVVMSAALAEQVVIDGSYKDGSSFQIDGVQYKIAFRGHTVYGASPFNIFVVDEGDCKSYDYYDFCLAGFEVNEIPSDTTAKIKVIKSDCISYTNSSGETACKLPIYSACDSNKDCLSTCLHHVCTAKTPICGDGYCDEKENCQQDCQSAPDLISINPFQITFAANKDWVDVHYEFKQDKEYSFSFNGTYFLDWKNTAFYSDAPKDPADKNLPCPEARRGAIVARLCNKCYEIGQNSVIKPNSDCKLSLRINEWILVDNSGNVTTTITELDTKRLSEQNEKDRKDMVERYVSYYNAYKFNDMAAMSTGKIKDIFNMRMDAVNRISAIIKTSLQNYEKVSIVSVSYDSILDTAVAKISNTTSTVEWVFYFSKTKDGLYLQDVEINGKGLSLISLEQEQARLNDLVESYRREFATSTPAKTPEPKEQGNPFASLLIMGLLIAGGVYVYKRRTVSRKLQDANSGIAYLNIQFNKIQKQREELVKEYNDKVNLLNKEKIEKEEKKEKHEKLLAELQSKLKETDSQVNTIEQKIKNNESAIAEKLKKQIQLEKDSQELDLKIADLEQKKVERQVLLEQKNKIKEDLTKRCEEELRLAREEYTGEELKREEKAIKEDFDASLIKADKEIEKIVDSLQSNVLEEKTIVEEKKELAKKSEIVKAKKVDESDSKLSSIVKREEAALPTNYIEFKESYGTNFSKCDSWIDYVKAYINKIGKNTKQLSLLARFIQEKENADNYDYIYETIKQLFAAEIKNSGPDVIEDLKEIDDMDGHEFEEYLNKMFTVLGYKVRQIKLTRDGGVDLILDKDGAVTLIQAKRYKITGVVGVEAVRDVYAQKDKYKATRFMVLTTCMNYSLDAKKEAAEKGIELLNRDNFKEMLRKAKLIKNG